MYEGEDSNETPSEGGRGKRGRSTDWERLRGKIRVGNAGRRGGREGVAGSGGRGVWRLDRSYNIA